MSKRDDTQVRYKPKTYNSCVSPGAKFEFGIDIMDMESTYATSNARYGLVAIDISFFTNTAEVVPIKHRTPEAMIDGLFKEYIYFDGKTQTAILR